MKGIGRKGTGKRGLLWVSLAVAFMMLHPFTAGLAAQSANEANEDAGILSKDDNGKTVYMKVGKNLEIQLEGNPTTGYWWYPDDLEGGYLQLLSESKIRRSNRPGATSVGVWRFAAMKPGTVKITLRYYRPWEGKDKSIDTFSVMLKIE